MDAFFAIFLIFFLNLFSYIQKSLKFKKIKKDYQKKACERYQNLFKEEKEKKQQYGCERYKNL